MQTYAHNIAGVVLAHSHPCADARPCDVDVVVARKLVDAGDLLGVPVLDYMVTAGDRHVSLRSTGQLRFG